MTKITQIENRGAVVAWSPLPSKPDLVALGTKDSFLGVGFEDHGGELELYDLGITHDRISSPSSPSHSPVIVGSVKTTSRFASIGWSPASCTTSRSGSHTNHTCTKEMGILAGGMVDGTVMIWNPSHLYPQDENRTTSTTSTAHTHPALLATIHHHIHPTHLSQSQSQSLPLQQHRLTGGATAAITALQFNPIPSSSHLLATGGGTQGDVFISTLDRPDHPVVTSPMSSSDLLHSSHSLSQQPPQPQSSRVEVTQVAWNTQVSHILASSYGNGTVTIWDLRQQKPWCQLRCENVTIPVSDMAWNPIQGLHIVTASADDRYPTLKLWDLRASTSVPLETLGDGHSQGILSISWCPHDESLLLSCGKDSRTILWDMYALKPVSEITSLEDTVVGTNGSSTLPTTTTSNSLSVPSRRGHGIHDAASTFGSTTVETTQNYGGGLGSTFGTTGSSTASSALNKKRYHVQWSPITRGVALTCSFDRKVEVRSILGEATKTGRPPKWMRPASGVSCAFGGSFVSFTSLDKIVTLSTFTEQPELKQVSTQFEKVIGDGNLVGFCAAKAESLAHNGDSYHSQVWGIMQVLFEDNARANLIQYLGLDPDAIQSSASHWNSSSEESTSALTGALSSKLSLRSTQEETLATQPSFSFRANATIKQALLVGNFDAAVECCFRCGNVGDALILASCGGPDLWVKTQKRYFDLERQKRPYLSIVTAVMDNRFGDFIQNSDPSTWHETLAMLCTYAPTEEFPLLCESLGDLLKECGDEANASLCYMCAYNLNKVTCFWRKNLNGTFRSMIRSRENMMALHSFIEKVAVFLAAVDPNQNMTLSDDIARLFDVYASELATQGLFTIAAKYCISNTQQCRELRDRLYRGKDGYACASIFRAVPDFPFNSVNVGVSASRSPHPTKHQPYDATVSMNGGQNQYPLQSYSHSQTNRNDQLQSHQPATIPQATVYENALPPGWISLQDPMSGRTYYANQTTGETTWDMPVNRPQVVAETYIQQQQFGTSVSAVSNEQVMVSSQHPQQYLQSTSAASQPTSWMHGQTDASATAVSTPAKLAAKYGDGFVTSASHPELAEQYGNVGTSNPYADARPGTAVVRKIEKPPVSGTPLDLSQPIDISPDYKLMVDGLLSYVASLTSLNLGGSEQKQLAEAEKGVAIFVKRLAKNDVTRDTAEKMKFLWTALQSKDFNTANAIQNGLVNTDWRDHKDWLKGLKFLIQIAAKYL